MFSLKYIIRPLHWTQSQIRTLTFLQPNLPAHPNWHNSTSSNSGNDNTNSTHHRAQKLWSLSERRALFLYTHQHEVRKLTPDWSHVSHTLHRDAQHCKFIATYMLKSFKQSGSNTPLPKGGKMDKDTEKWYAGLMHGKDLSVIVDESTGGPNGKKKKRAKRRTWTEKEDQIIMDHCALYRHPTETDMHEVIADLNASLQSICSRYRVLRRKLPKNVLPLTAEEHQAIINAVEERRPQMVRYMDVRDKIKRPFAEALYLTLPLRTQKKNVE